MAEREKQETLSETKELVTILQYEKKKKTSSMHIHATGHHQKIQDILFW